MPCRTEASLEGILAAAKSKRYPRTRLMRMLLCGFLGLSDLQLTELRRMSGCWPSMRTAGPFCGRRRADSAHPCGGAPQDEAFRGNGAGRRDLYGLFRETAAEPAPKSRVYVQRD